MQIGDIVGFVNAKSSLAAKFCYDYNIKAVVKRIDYGLVVVDAGLGYEIFVDRCDLELKVNCVPGLCGRSDLLNLIPQPCDDI